MKHPDWSSGSGGRAPAKVSVPTGLRWSEPELGAGAEGSAIDMTYKRGKRSEMMVGLGLVFLSNGEGRMA